MDKLFKAITHHKKTVITLFGVAAIICVILSKTVSVNYDMMDYLPDSAASTKALDVMKQEYEGGIPNARIMVPDVTIPEALDYKEKLAEINGVEEVTWLDDVTSLEIPLDVIGSDTVEDYYKDNCALFTITIEEEKQIEAVQAIRDLIGEEGSMTGSAVNTAISTSSTTEEVQKIILFVVPICFIILLLTTSAWFEPVLFMVTIGIAILLNKGTDAIFGEISFVTNAAGSILQLAVSMDYSIFLLHRFAEFREMGMETEEAMIKALSKSIGSIASSGLTTVIGFAALILMRFKIGPDMGIVMAKGIVFSLITVIILLPALALCSYKIIDKTHHKSFMPSFQKFAAFVNKVKIPMLIITVIMVIPCYLAQQNNKFYYGSSNIFGEENTQVGKDRVKIESIFGKSNQMVLLVPKGDFATETKLSNALHEVPQVNTILSYVDNAGAEVPTEYLDEEIVNKLLSEHYSRMVISVATDYEGEESFAVVEKIREIAHKYYKDDYLLAGDSVNTYDMMEVVTQDTVVVNGIAIGAILLILIVTFRSLLLPIILVVVIETGIWINLAVPYFSDYSLFYIAYLIISSIQLGATVDYAILLTNRYMDVRREQHKKKAIIETLSTTSVSILTSASILTISGFVLGYISTNRVLSQLGILIGRGAILSTVLVLFVLPASLYLFDFAVERKINKERKANIIQVEGKSSV